MGIVTTLKSVALTSTSVLAAALTVTLVVDHWRLARVRAQVAESSLAALNLAAERDSTRNAASAHRALAALLLDSLVVVEREVVQVRQRGDALDRALEGERRAAYTVYMKADSLHRVLSARGVDSLARPAGASGAAEGARTASFDVRQKPYTVHATVAIPPAPATATMALDVRLDSLWLEARISCSKADAAGVRRAAIDAVAPRWARIRFGSVEQEPAVCQGEPTKPAHTRWPVGFRPLVLGGGVVNARGGWRVGAFVGVGWVVGFSL